MNRMNQSDFLPESKPVYPYILIEDTDDNTSGIIQCLPDGEDLPICIEHFGDIICLKTMGFSFHSVGFLIKNAKIRLVTEIGSSDIQKDLIEFLKIYNESQKGA